MMKSDGEDNSVEETQGVEMSSKSLRVPELNESEGGGAMEMNPDAVPKKEGGKGKKTKERLKKRRIHSDSDFESNDSGETKKKRKRKNKAKDQEEDEESKPKRRRRIMKQTRSSDDGTDSDVQILNESENGGKFGRKNIKKIMKDKNLQVRPPLGRWH